MILVPREHITYDVLNSEGLKAVRYAVNHIDANIPAKNVIKLSESKANCLREFQNIFIRSRLQLVGMTHGIMEFIVKNIIKFARKEIDFVQNELNEIKNTYEISKIMYSYTCNNISPEKSVSDKLMEANILKTLATEYTYKAAQIAQKLLGAKGFETGHPMSNVAIDFRPFTIFEGPNDMLYAEIYDQFSRATTSEKKDGIRINKNSTIYERFLSDKRFKKFENTFINNIINESNELIKFLKNHTLNEIDQVKKVFVGKILARLFLLIQSESDNVIKFLMRDIRKDIIDFEYNE